MSDLTESPPDQTKTPIPTANTPVISPPPVRSKPNFDWIKKHKLWVALGALVLVTFATGIVIAMTNSGSSLVTTIIATPTPSPTPTLRAALLDGTLVSNEAATRHPLAIMIENTPDTRPQTGIGSASIVYEAIVEGGITRFMAVFGPTVPDKVGPVRSARQVYVDLIKEFPPVSAYYVHVGGAPDALSALKGDKLYDLDQFAIGSKAFERIPKAGVATEHTMYTYPSKLYTIASDRQYSTLSTMRSWKFKADTLITNRPETQTIAIPFSSATYDVTYVYDKVTNTYKRQLLGKDATDAATGKAITPKNVIAQFTTYSTRKGDDKGRQDVGITAGGTAKVFRDGLVIEAKWARDKATNRTIYTDAASGQEIELNAGQTFVEIVKSDAVVIVK